MIKSNEWNLISIEDFYNNLNDLKSRFSNAIIAEIAGKDSIAAVLKAIESSKHTNLLGIGINHRSFFGNIQEPLEHFKYISNQKTKYAIEEIDFLYLDVSNLFDYLILQNMAIVQKYFHYYSPCPACHLFFHMIRVPIAHELKITEIITGERDFHGNKKKLNQLPSVLDLFRSLLEKEKIKLNQVLKPITSNEKIYNILGDTWKSASPYFCSFSGNYYDENGVIPFQIKNILNSLEFFYYPLFHDTIKYIEKNQIEPSKSWIHKKIKTILEN